MFRAMLVAHREYGSAVNSVASAYDLRFPYSVISLLNKALGDNAPKPPNDQELRRLRDQANEADSRLLDAFILINQHCPRGSG